MLSILIPTYDYNIFPLVNLLNQQAQDSNIIYEIITIDDGSTKFHLENKTINTILNCSYEILNKNTGRSGIRNLLAKKAQYENLLFLDADTLPLNENFIEKYLSEIKNDFQIIYGGIEYQKLPPEKNKKLRWAYGKAREALSVEKRNLKPYLSFLTLNFLIKKSVFDIVCFNENIPNLRHEDTLYSYDLMRKKIRILHIDNPVCHLGLDDFKVAINKENQSLVGLKYLIDHQLLIADYVQLSKIAAKIDKLKLNFVFVFFYKITRSVFLKNLSSNNPSLFIFDLYRLGNLCNLNAK